MNLSKYGQYKKDIFTKLNYKFISGKKILDLGCGDGSDAEIFIKNYHLKTYGIDIYKNKKISKIKKLKFKKAGIYKIPYPDSTFDYVFLHDVLHHIDEKGQSWEKHLAGLRELERVCKKNGKIIIVEGNRYNPLFYPHMVKMLGHNHFTQGYFKSIITTAFPNAKFKYFEAHLYPQSLLFFWKAYEYIMEKFVSKSFLAYNVAIITNQKKLIKETIFAKRIPPKNIFVQALLFLKFPLLIPGVKWIIKKYLKYCKNTDFIFGFRCLYGNIHAKNAFLSDTFFADYAPVYIGKNSKFSFDNIILTSTHDIKKFNLVKARPVYIGKNVWITSRCIILGGVTIGDNTIIGAGSVVTHDIPANCFAAGNPCKVIKKIH